MAAQQLRVFVSHASEDNAFCHAIVTALRDAGADVWYDEHNMGSGRLQDVILRELGSRPIFVLILSKHAIGSKWVKRETDWAEELGDRDPSRVFLPVTAGQIERNDFGADNGWLAYYNYKRIEASGFAPYAVAEAANRLLRALGLTPIGATPTPVAPQPSESVDDLLTRGRALIAQKQFAEALPLFERATQLAPGSPTAWGNLGVVLNMLKHWQDALAAHDQSLALTPNYDVAWNNKGVALNNLGRYTEALVAYDRALALNPKNLNAWVAKGEMLYRLKRHKETLVALDRALALDDKLAGVWCNKGRVLNDLGRFRKALAASDRALALDDKLAWAWYNKGEALYRLKRFEEALVALNRALALDPNEAAAWAALAGKGTALHALKRYDEALAAYDRALALNSKHANAWRNKALSLRALGRTAEAEAAEKRAKELGWTG